MGWTFRDFLTANGRNPIRDWLDGLPDTQRAEINARLALVETLDRLRRPYTAHEDGLVYKVRLESQNVQYRPLFCFGPGRRDLTLLAGATERDNVLRPPGIVRVAQERAENIRDNSSRTVEHDY